MGRPAPARRPDRVYVFGDLERVFRVSASPPL
jgi:hypothetical protein